MKKTKQFLVLGLGSFGNSVAKTICELGHEALAVDGDLEKVERATEFVTQAVQANITDEATLRSMGIRNYDACIVAIGKDLKASILVCMMLKDMEAKYIIAKANDNIHAKILRQLGVDRVVFPERDTGIRVANSIVTNNVLDLMELNDDF
ncbi:MAG: TrkA family potassium uptake protein, partial [Christensenellaceae bacterium]|nr:TrkA family potassium uptake protein [Christensenellaceae bacterium]